MNSSDKHAKPADSRQGGAARLKRVLLLAALLLISLSLLLLGLAPVGAYLFYKSQPDTAVMSSPAGRVLRVQLDGGLYSRALVETDSGFYSLSEGVSLSKGEAVTVEERTNQRRFLCDTRHLCTQLLRPLP